MRFEEKQEVARELNELLQSTGTVYLTDFTGLDVKSLTELRNRLSRAGLGYRVVKNTLMERALEGLEWPDISDHLAGPTALVVGGEDPVAPAKVVKEFAREHDNRPVVKIGLIDRRTVTPEEVDRLAELPGRDELLGGIAGSLTAPVAGVVGVLEALVRDIATMIEEVARQQEAGSS